MPKKYPTKLRVQAYADAELYEDVLLVEDEAYKRFFQLIEYATILRFHHVNRITLTSGNHILFVFQDVRKIVNQNHLKF